MTNTSINLIDQDMKLTFLSSFFHFDIQHLVYPGCNCKTVKDPHNHYNDVILSAMASEITSLTIVYSTVYSGADQRKHQSCASLAFVRGIHRWPVNSPHKGSVTRKMFPFEDVIMSWLIVQICHSNEGNWNYESHSSNYEKSYLRMVGIHKWIVDMHNWIIQLHKSIMTFYCSYHMIDRHN